MSKLKAWREASGLTQDEAGEKVGVSAVAWGRYERGRVPEPAVMQKIIDLTSSAITANDFFDIDHGPTSSRSHEPTHRESRRPNHPKRVGVGA